ncbi:ead/Ea22-like family protein [Salmonella enterica subsp. enterica serovar Schwarzengrund]|uniref:Ead/Ea22-like family protein n=1 Tax=Salmonella enterica subsp. enterica serovar Bredeney TaxID=134047 RepID=A0A5W2T4W9_SALET|nr:ead/Ea22-like family protein [Salmonella enterica subsp. enterica serovar Bredeney]EFA9941790.1 ead/Ea22-like family protein [Salmonella enterica]EIJ1300383.1 ead/Ea22-like family protein [Salmonella enterica subsp. enterica serovar Schwarzengrund]EBW5240512.1 ead/Ea22-like family protein [Salmonella enterica subsp. enterica serovar Bredeney]EDA5838797.1 ead/Ea22-like family protein [Salmonella enterica subsp. enterica serovar Bredeney]
MGYISQFEASDIDSDDIDLRFEVDGVETGTTVSIVDECGHAAQIITALLDELEHYKSREERVTKLVLDNSTSWDALYKKLEAAEKRIAELESNEVREVGNQFLVVRHPGKTPVIKHCTGDPEEFLRKLIEQDPLVTIDIITHRYYGIGGQWVQDAVEYLHMMSDAGIRIKGE